MPGIESTPGAKPIADVTSDLSQPKDGQSQQLSPDDESRLQDEFSAMVSGGDSTDTGATASAQGLAHASTQGLAHGVGLGGGQGSGAISSDDTSSAVSALKSMIGSEITNAMTSSTQNVPDLDVTKDDDDC